MRHMIWVSAMLLCGVATAAFTSNTLQPTARGYTALLTNSTGFQVALNVSQAMEANVTRVTLQPVTSSPFRVPSDVFAYSADSASLPTWSTTSPVKVTQDAAGAVTVQTPLGTTLFSIDPSTLSFDAQVVSLRFAAPSGSFLSGYGEHNYYYFINSDSSLNIKDDVLALWNTDDGIPWRNPLYGVHPVIFVAVPSSSLFFAIFFANSNAQQLRVANGTTNVTMTFTGGIIDAFVISGSDMLDVIARYHRLIGPTMVPPYWSLGTHQCRWGYTNLSDVKAVVAGYAANDLPLETMWNDIDYMDKYRIFTTDPVRYPTADVAQFAAQLHANNQHYIQIVDPGVAAADDYATFVRGSAADAFVKVTTPKNETIPLINVVWPGWTAYPDFSSPASRTWWSQEMSDYLATVPLDGIWLDMNEMSAFCAGYCNIKPNSTFSLDWKDPAVWNIISGQICPDNCTVNLRSSLNSAPFNPLTDAGEPGWNLYNKTYDLTAATSQGAYYDTKTFMGMWEGRATHAALLNHTRNATRPFILSRSTFAGSGAFVAHWTGDNYAAWERRTAGIMDSVQGVLASNLVGIGMVGADIGGFSGTTNDELLTRWTQLGAFYTFMRNHHDNQGPGQEPYRFSQRTIDAVREAMNHRYLLLPYLFTAFIRSHYEGGPILRHPSVQFPMDINTYQLGDAESTSFFFGPNVLVAPVVIQGATNVTCYVPAGTWYTWRSTAAPLVLATGARVVLEAPYDRIPVLVRGGSVLPLHTSAELTVAATRASGVTVACYLDVSGRAVGDVMVDDGVDGLLPPAMGSLQNATFNCTGNRTNGTAIISFGANALNITGLRVYDTQFPRFLLPASASASGASNLAMSVDTLDGALFFGFSTSNTTASITISWGPAPSPQTTSGEVSKTFVALFSVFIVLFAAAVIVAVKFYFKVRDAEMAAEIEALNAPRGRAN